MTDSRVESRPPADTHIKPFLQFLDWLDPPIAFDMSSLDSAHPNYQVRIMIVKTGDSSVINVPFTEFLSFNPKSSFPDIWQFQSVTGLPGDALTPKFYTTMTVIQGAPGFARVRSRVFVIPQSNFTQPNWVDSSHLALAATPGFFVSGVFDSNGNPKTVSYAHILLSDPNVDPNGPREIYLQQPF
jgi:hypothetical protein